MRSTMTNPWTDTVYATIIYMDDQRGESTENFIALCAGQRNANSFPAPRDYPRQAVSQAQQVDKGQHDPLFSISKIQTFPLSFPYITPAHFSRDQDASPSYIYNYCLLFCNPQMWYTRDSSEWQEVPYVTCVLTSPGTAVHHTAIRG